MNLLKSNITESFEGCCDCQQSTKDFAVMVDNEEKLVTFLQLHGIFLSQLTCPECGKHCKLKKDLRWFCGKTKIERRNKKVLKNRCNFSRSIKENTLFSGSKLPLNKLCMLIYSSCYLRKPGNQFVEEDLRISRHTVINWFSVCRELCVRWCEQRKEKIGGDGKIVEICEVELGKHKYTHERWAFGGYERDGTKLFVLAVADGSKGTLLNVIMDWILPNTDIISDCWKAYDCVEDEGFVDLTVSNRIRLVDPGPEGHIAQGEESWKDLHANVPKSHYYGYLCEFLWKRSVPNHAQRIHTFFKDMVAKVRTPVEVVERDEQSNQLDRASTDDEM